MMKKIGIVFAVVVGMKCGVRAAEFVITKKAQQVVPNHSRTKLKERLGSVTKDAFHASRGLVRQIGKANVVVANLHEKKQTYSLCQSDLVVTQKQAGELQVIVSKLQKKFSGTLECLLDNRAPFKRASRSDLGAAHKAVYDVAVAFDRCKQQIKICNQALEQQLNVKKEEVLAQATKIAVSSNELSDQNRQAVTKLKDAVQAANRTMGQLQKNLAADNCLKQI